MKSVLSTQLWSDCFLLLPALCQASSRHCDARDSAPTVTLASGVLVGTTTSLPSATAVVNKFLGVPFADSPPERFSPPQDPRPWSQPLSVLAVKPACIQQWPAAQEARDLLQRLWNNPGGPPPAESEDCLYLNVFAPSTAPPPGGRAIMFWLFGGSLQWGQASNLWYDGSVLAAYQDVIVVAPNYRTNVFGFSNSPQLPLASRNAGFLDQRQALAWVQANIVHFGGDPSKVTIFGWSAGGTSVDNLVTTTPKDPPFRAAIMESGQNTYGVYFPKGVGIAAWQSLVEALNCSAVRDALACVRAADAMKIKEIIEVASLPFIPTVDNITELANPSQARSERRIANVPLMIGTTAQDGRTPLGPNNLTAFLETAFPDEPKLRADIVAAYPIGQGGLNTEYDIISQIITDFGSQCVSGLLASRNIEAGYPTWRFIFNATFPNNEAFPNGGAYHGTQVPLVFGTYPSVNVTAQEAALSSYMQAAWAGFAKNPERGPGWNQVGSFDGVDLGLLGQGGSAGVTVMKSAEVDLRCGIYREAFERRRIFY
ncbi:hypothetical protein GJ744_006615 [Endocarpon pusillum]|uniref:Carboxylic ester hydrolase n=1 Tax=Endocarpon pusillum TaxID=364733 RepID=A0A8H7EBQ5_9EURO|nr:hypothetical protein GJ744_006615 [Endocarpon pusillum]